MSKKRARENDAELPMPGLEMPERETETIKQSVQKRDKEWDSRFVEAKFRKTLGDVEFEIKWTKNIRRAMEIYTEENVLIFRLHELFMYAPDEVHKAIAGCAIKTTEKRKKIIKDFAEMKMTDMAENANKAKVRLVSKGEWRDLDAIMRGLNEKYFGGTVDARIGWAKRRLAKGKKRVIMGSYNPFSNIIRIHPVLDDWEAPIYVLEYTIYHEMVHAKLKVMYKGKRKSFHNDEFYELLNRYEHKKDAEAWEKEKLEKLLLKFKP